jgi:hypothetical protein
MATKTKKSKNLKFSQFISKHWWKIGILVLFVGSLTFVGYNKYLDQQNVNNMKQLLADFEQLEKDVEAETGEELTIGTSCGDIEEKFINTPSCYIYIESINIDNKKFSDIAILKVSDKLASNGSCGSFGGIGFTFKNSKNVIYSCYPLIVRDAVKNEVYELMKIYSL